MNAIFEECETWIKQSYENNKISIDKLYQQCEEVDIGLSKREVVISKLLDYMEKIQKIAINHPMPNKMISISLQDLKTFNLMVSTLVMEGVYPCLSPNVNVPLNLRVKTATTDNRIEEDNSSENRNLLEKIVDSVEKMLTTQGDVRDVLLRGTYTADFICAAIELAFNPSPQKEYIKKFTNIRDQIQTFDLYECFTTLLRPNCPNWFKSVVSRQLAILPTSRENGVRALIEFVSGLRTQEQISLTTLDRAIQVLKSIPKGADEIQYSRKVGQQLVTILGRTVANAHKSAAGPANTLKSTVLHVINVLYEQKPSVIENGFKQVLTEKVTTPQTEKSLNEGLNALATMSISSSELMDKLQTRLVVPVWSLLCYYKSTKRSTSQLKELLISLIKNFQDASLLDEIIKNLLVKGVGMYSFGAGSEGGVEIRENETEIDDIQVFQALDDRVDLFISLLEKLDEEMVSSLFVRIMRRWLAASNEEVMNMLIDARILERISQDYKDKIIKSPKEILQVVSSVLTKYTVHLEDKPQTSDRLDNIVDQKIEDSDDEDSDDEDSTDNDEIKEMAGMCLSLVAGIAPEIPPSDQPLLAAFKPQLEIVANRGPAELSTKAQTVMEFIGIETKTGENNSNNDDVNKIKKALVSLDDPMVPIRAHGLHQIRELIKTRSSVLSVDKALKILLNQLKDDDSFVYLNSIKALEELSDLNGAKLVVPKLLEYYTNTKSTLDDRLKSGEVLLRIVQRLDEAFVGEVADTIVSTMIDQVSAKNKDKNEEPLRNSALSILGATCQINPRGLSNSQLIDSLDCAIGVLTFERDSGVMRSAAVVLIGSLILGVDTLNQVPKEFVSQIMTRLRTARDDDNDALVRVQATTTLDRIRQKLVQ